MNPGIAYARAGAQRGLLYGGLGGAALGGAMFGLPKKDPQGSELTGKQRLGRAAVGALGFGVLGAMHGKDIGWNSRARKWNSGFRPAPGTAGGIPKPATPDWLAGATTKAEGRRAWHAQARKLHPDLGGSEDAIKNLNAEWETHEPLFKRAMYSAFADELEKIASLGALIGGAAGWKLSPNSTKSKIYGTLGGAALGHLTGKGLSAAKREMLDQYTAREHEALYGYTAPGREPIYGGASNF